MTNRQAKLKNGYSRLGFYRPQDLELVLESIHWFIELDLVLYSIWQTYRDYLPYGSEPDPYAPARAASLLSADTRVKGGVLALASEMVRLDNARWLLKTVGEDQLFAHLLNKGSPAHHIPPETYDRVLGGLFEPERRVLLKKLLVAYEQRHETLTFMARSDGDLAYIISVLQDGDESKILRKEESISSQFRFAGTVASRTIAGLLVPFHEFELMRGMDEGLPKGSIRKPSLSSVPGLSDTLYDTLEPMDVLLLRHDNSGARDVGLTHAVIYIGDYRSLKQAGLNLHPALAIHGSALRRGEVFVEISGTGVHLLSMAGILQAQGLALIRLGSFLEFESEAREILESTPFGGDALHSMMIPPVALNAGGENEEHPPSSLLAHTLDTMMLPEFVSPSDMTDSERSARFLGAIFGAKTLGVELKPGQTVVSLREIGQVFISPNRNQGLIFVGWDGAVAEATERTQVFEQIAQ